MGETQERPAGQSQPRIPAGAFSFASQVFFDELDPMHMLHNARYAVHVERATSALYRSLGFRFERDIALNPDQHHAVRHFEIEFAAPVLGERELYVRLWIKRLGTSSCQYGFACLSADKLNARGSRTIVKIDPANGRPLPWTELFRERQASLIEATIPDRPSVESDRNAAHDVGDGGAPTSAR